MTRVMRLREGHVILPVVPHLMALVTFYVMVFPSVFCSHQHNFYARHVILVTIDIHNPYLACGGFCGGMDHIYHAPCVLPLVHQYLARLCHRLGVPLLTLSIQFIQVFH